MRAIALLNQESDSSQTNSIKIYRKLGVEMFGKLYIDRIVNFSGLNVWDPLLFAGTLNVVAEKTAKMWKIRTSKS